MADAHRVSVDHKLCIGCNCCSQSCTNFEVKRVGDNFKSFPKQEVITGDLDNHISAVEGCPVSCIKVEKVNK